MPELPEIIAHAERLATQFAGAELAKFVPLHITALKTFTPFPETAIGYTFVATGHRGKYLFLHFDHPKSENRLTFVVHLMQAGRLRSDVKQSAKPYGGLARWVFTDGRALLLTEAGSQRRAGVWLLAGDGIGSAPVEHLGPDADTISRQALAKRLADKNRRIHGFLRDQRQLAGIGRLLANEILYMARLSPFANTTQLHDQSIDRLHRAIGAALARGLTAERELTEMGRSADRPNDVHHRVGLECTRCGDVIRAVEYRSYKVAYCATCQTDGKVLKDNTTSRFLK